AHLFIGAAKIGNFNLIHPTVSGTFDAGITAKTLTFPHVTGAGTNLVLMLRSNSATVPALVFYGSAGFPSGINVVEHGSSTINAPPVALFACAVSELTLACDGTASTDDIGIASYAWSFGDGATATTSTASHTYATAGAKTVTLIVTDTDGATGGMARTYTVAGPTPVEEVELRVDGVVQDSVVVSSTTPGDHAWSTTLDLSSLAAGSHTILARWLDVDGTELDTDQVTINVGTSSGPTVTITSPSNGATVSGNVDVTGTVERGTGTQASPWFGLQSANLVHPSGQSLYLHTATLPVGNLDRAAGGADLVEQAPASQTPSVSAHAASTAPSEGAAGASWTYHGPVALTGATVTVTWYGRQLSKDAAVPEQWEASIYIGATQIANINLPHASAVGSFDSTLAAKTLTIPNVSGSGTNLVLMLRSTTATAPVLVFFGSTGFPSGLTIAEGAANVAPVAAFSCTPTELSVACDGSASTDDDAVTSYAWAFGDGATATGATASHTYGTEGTKTVTLTVTDTDGATDMVSHTYTLTAANVAPVAAFSCTVSQLTVSCDGGASTDDDAIASYAWAFGDGATASGVTASHTYGTAGAKTVTLTVTDTDGATDSASQEYTVSTTPANEAPVAAFSCTTSDLSVSCDGSASTDDDAIASYAWAFGDGATGSGVTASHTYGTAGAKTVSLTVTDGEGVWDVVSHDYTVAAPLSEQVQLLVDGVVQSSVTVDSAVPGSHAWTASVTVAGVGSHAILARWLDADGTELDTDTVTVEVADGGTGTSTSTSTSSSTSGSSSSATGTNTGSAGGSVNNVAPVVDGLGVSPAVVDLGDAVDVDGTGFDDNGQEDVVGATVKVTSPGGATSFPGAQVEATGATDVAFHATHVVAGDAESGTYQVDSFLADASGAQSSVVSVTFTVLAPAQESVDVSYTGSAQRLEFGGFNPGAVQVESQNAFGVTNHGPPAHFWFDMTDFACSRGVVPVDLHSQFRPLPHVGPQVPLPFPLLLSRSLLQSPFHPSTPLRSQR
ncbi:MAG: PKD domain-containing protein, partial [Halobacteriales archaeon]|nr:PKD domain-containing protein [Halobacteriales archaeon]